MDRLLRPCHRAYIFDQTLGRFKRTLERSLDIAISPLLTFFAEESTMSVLTQEKVVNGSVSPSTTQKNHFSTFIDEDVTKRRIWRKLDTHLLPLVSLLELLSFL
jgi:hypothetical protein